MFDETLLQSAVGDLMVRNVLHCMDCFRLEWRVTQLVRAQVGNGNIPGWLEPSELIRFNLPGQRSPIIVRVNGRFRFRIGRLRKDKVRLSLHAAYQLRSPARQARIRERSEPRISHRDRLEDMSELVNFQVQGVRDAWIRTLVR